MHDTILANSLDQSRPVARSDYDGDCTYCWFGQPHSLAAHDAALAPIHAARAEELEEWRAWQELVAGEGE